MVELESLLEVNILEVSCIYFIVIVNICNAVRNVIYLSADVYCLHFECCGQVAGTPSYLGSVGFKFWP
jgi:hypothetical protein